jgi:hypothetical protein
MVGTAVALPFAPSNAVERGSFLNLNAVSKNSKNFQAQHCFG